MKPQFNMKAKDFHRELAEYAAQLRRMIEAEVDGFSTKTEDILARRKAVSDPKSGFEYFVTHYFPHYIQHKTKSELHEYLFELLPAVAANPERCSEAVAAPRGEAKSTIVTQLYTLWRIVTGQTKFAVIVMDSIDQSYPMLETIKAELEFNPRIATDFPAAAGQGRVWQAGTIVTANNVKVQVAGSGKRLRGMRHGPYRPDLCILDDIENDEQVQNPEQRKKLLSWLQKTITPLGGVGKKYDIIYIGTILHYDSVLAQTLRNKFWHGRIFKAIKTWPERMDLWEEWEIRWKTHGRDEAMAFYRAHQAEMEAGAQTSWAARGILDLMIERAKIGSQAFACEYQNDPASGEDSPFADLVDHCYYLDKDLPPDVVYYGAVDPSLGKSSRSRDPSAILVGAYQQSTGTLFVQVANIRRRVPDLIIEQVIALQKEYHCQVWAVETVQFQEFFKDELVKRSARAGYTVPARGIKPNSDKALRIESLQPHMANGLIKFRQEQRELIEQLRHFPDAEHDDGPDALHMLWMVATTGNRSNSARVIYLPQLGDESWADGW